MKKASFLVVILFLLLFVGVARADTMTFPVVSTEFYSGIYDILLQQLGSDDYIYYESWSEWGGGGQAQYFYIIFPTVGGSLSRIYMQFDTSDLPNDAIVTSASFVFYGISSDENVLSNFTIQKGTFDFPITDAMFNDSWEGNTYDIYSINGTLQSYTCDLTNAASDISVSGLTKFVIREYDLDYLEQDYGVVDQGVLMLYIPGSYPQSFMPYLSVTYTDPPNMNYDGSWGTTATVTPSPSASPAPAINPDSVDILGFFVSEATPLSALALSFGAGLAYYMYDKTSRRKKRKH